MPFNVILLPLLGGFIFISKWNRTRWYAQRLDKERLLFYAALAGLASYSLATVLASIPPFIPCIDYLPCPPAWWDRHVPFPHSGVSTFAFLIGATSWRLLNFYWKEPEETARVIETEGGPLEQMLDKSMQEEKLVLVTLKGGKVYAGRIGSSFEPGDDEGYIRLLPRRSGYREKEKQRVNFTTNYEDAYERIESDHPETYTEIIADFSVVLALSEVVSISIYDPLIHETYFAHVETAEDAAEE